MIKELEFTQQGDAWIADVAVENDFNVHVETAGQKVAVVVELSTVADGKKSVKDSKLVDADGVFDEDYDVLIVPKYLRIRTTAPVARCVITVKEE